MSKLGAIYDFLKITASAAGLALLLSGPALAASIETPPGAAPGAPPVTPPGAAAQARGDANGDRIEDALAARIAAAAIGDRFDVIVVFEGPNAVSRGRAAAGPFAVTREFSVINGFQASLTAAQIRGLSRAPGLFRISENGEVEAFDIPSNDDMGVTNARLDFPVDGTGVTICVVDTGVNAAHEQFDSKGLGPGSFHDAINGQANPYDDHGHGTHVSGISTGDGAGPTSLADDAIGVAPGASLVVAKVLAANGSGTDAQVIEGIEWCAARTDVDILSMSLGDPNSTDGTDTMSMAVNCVADPSPGTCGGTNIPKIVVIAAGNSGALWSTVGTPGVAANAITVGSVAEWSGNPATNWQDDGLYLNSFSSRGPVVDASGAVVRIKPDITAPGSQVLSAYIGASPNAYAVASGTSMATPFVSGVIALMLDADPTLGVVTADGVLPHVKVRNILALTAEHRGDPVPNNEYGYGVIDAYGAVAEALGAAYVPNAYPGYIRLPGENVADFGNWTHEFTVTPDLVGLPIAGTATIDGTFVEGCLFWFGNICAVPSNLWSPDLELILEQELTPGAWSQVAAGSGEATFSECPARGECGQVGRAEVVHFIPQSTGTFRFRVFPADDTSNLGVGGNFDFEISMGAPAPDTGGNLPPTAGFSFTTSESNLIANFTDASFDIDGTIASWSWDFGDGGTSTAASPSHTYVAAGTYSVILTVIDDAGDSDTTDAQSVTVPAPPNVPPTANFTFGTSDLTASFADTSTDSDGTIASRSWDFGDGSPLSTATNPSHAYAAEGTYSVTLTVTDDDGASSVPITKSVTVTAPVPNVPPVASFTVDRNPCGGLIENRCEFTDTSTDSDGTVVSWTWDFGGGSVAGGIPGWSGHQMLVDFPADGPNPVTVTLTATDNDGATHMASMELPISAPAVTNDPPTATITAPANGSTYDSNAPVTFTGTASDTEDGDLSASLSWSSSRDGAIGTGASVSTAALSAGTHTITASVTDSGALSGQSSITVTVNPPPNTAPTVAITAPVNGSIYTQGNPVSFTGTASDAEDGSITASLAWTSSLDGAIGSGGGFSTTSLSVGAHTVTASVTDSGDLNGQASVTVTVEPLPLTVNAHIGDLDDDSAPGARGRWDAHVAVLVLDDSGGAGAPVANALVAGNWSNGTTGGGSCTTSATGQCTVSKPNLKSNVSGVTFTVTGISGTDIAYQGAANTDPDGSSNGTVINLTQPGTSSNQAPSATISAPADGASFDSGASITFTGSASDAEEGNLTSSLSWSSSIDGNIGSGASFSTPGLSDGTHTITASVTDSGSLNGADTISITVGSAGGFTMAATGYKVKGIQTVDLSWNGATGAVVDIHRNGANVETTENDAFQAHSIGAKGNGSYNFQICETGGSVCSNIVTVVF